MKAFHHEFKRNYDGTLTAEIYINTKKPGEPRKVKFTYDFDCLPYILHDLSKLWQQERASRMSKISDINKRLPDSQ